jgi:hypothetical protein
MVAAGIASAEAAVLDGLSGAGCLQGPSHCSSRHGTRAGILWLLRPMQHWPIPESDGIRAAADANPPAKEHDAW